MLAPQRFSTARSFPAQQQEISRGKTLNFHRVDAQFIKHIPVADGGLGSHVPAGPEYVTPHIEFLFIAPRFALKGPTVGALGLLPAGAPETSLTGLALALSLTFGLVRIRLRIPGIGTFTQLVKCHARHTR